MTTAWVCAQSMQLIRADRIISLEVSEPRASVKPAVWALVEGGEDGATATRVKLTGCGQRRPEDILSDLAHALGYVETGPEYQDLSAVFIYASDSGREDATVWHIAEDFPDAWPSGLG